MVLHVVIKRVMPIVITLAKDHCSRHHNSLHLFSFVLQVAFFDLIDQYSTCEIVTNEA